MEITTPARVTASAEKRAGPFMFVFFSFRLRFRGLAWNKLQLAGSQGEKIVLLQLGFDLWSQQPDPIHTRGMSDINRSCHSRKCQRIVRLHKQSPVGATGVDCLK